MHGYIFVSNDTMKLELNDRFPKGSELMLKLEIDDRFPTELRDRFPKGTELGWELDSCELDG